MTDQTLSGPLRGTGDRPAVSFPLRFGPRIFVVLFVLCLVAGIVLTNMRARENEWLRANEAVVDATVTEVIFTEDVGYQNVVEFTAETGEPMRILGAPREVAVESWHMGRVTPVRYWPTDLSRTPQIVDEARDPTPVAFELFLRGMGLMFFGMGYAVLKKAALLAREGVRLNGRILRYQETRVKDHIQRNAIVYIEDPPHAGKVFTSKDATFPASLHPVGSSYPVLAHPDRDVFELDRPGRASFDFGLALTMGLLFSVAPDLFAWAYF